MADYEKYYSTYPTIYEIKKTFFWSKFGASYGGLREVLFHLPQYIRRKIVFMSKFGTTHGGLREVRFHLPHYIRRQSFLSLNLVHHLGDYAKYYSTYITI